MIKTQLPLSNGVASALRLAKEEAQRLGHRHIETGHFLIGLARSSSNSYPSNANELLASQGIDVAQLLRKFESTIGLGMNAPTGEMPVDHILDKAIIEAEKMAKDKGQEFIGTLDVLEVLSDTPNCDAKFLLDHFGFDPGALKTTGVFALREKAAMQSAPAFKAPSDQFAR